jgi:hypothetical protein
MISGNSRRAHLSYVAVALPLFGMLTWAAFWYQPSSWLMGSDFWEHSATLKAWSADLWGPSHPHLAEDIPGARYIPFYFVVAAFGSLLQLDPFQAMGLAGAIAAATFLIATPLFFNYYFCSPWAGVIAVLVLFFGWGASWLWSSVNQLRTLFYVMAYPSFWTFGFSFVVFWQQMRILRRNTAGPSQYGLLTAIVAVTFLSHPLTGAFAAVTSALLALTEPGHPSNRRILSLGAIALGLLVARLWPYYPVWYLVFVNKADVMFSVTAGACVVLFVLGMFQNLYTNKMLMVFAIAVSSATAVFLLWSTSESFSGHFGLAVIDNTRFEKLIGSHPFYSLKDVLITMGPALLGIPALIYLALTRKSVFAPIGALAFLAVYVANLFIDIPLGHRFFLYFVFYCHFAIIAALLAMVSRQKVLVVGFLAILSIWGMALAVAETLGYHLNSKGMLFPRYALRKDFKESYKEIAKHIGPMDVVLSPALAGWPLPTYAGKIIALYHTNPLVRDSSQRTRDSEAFFDLRTTNRERRELIARYGAKHLFFDIARIHPAVILQLLRLSEKHYHRHDGFVLLDLRLR